MARLTSQTVSRWRRALSYPIVLACMVGATPVRVAHAQAPESLDRVRAAMESWLEARGLATTIEVQKLRWVARLDDPSARSLKLELRFITPSTEQDAENQRFVTALQQFQSANTTSLAEALFFKLVHLANVRSEDAAVSIAVLENTFAVAPDRTSGRLRFDPTSDRQVRLEVQLPAAASARQPQVVVPGPIQAGALPVLIQQFLKDFFARKNAEARLAAPLLSLKPLTPNYVGLDVEGIRRLVIPSSNFWEFLQISIQVYDTALGRSAACFLDGGYAPGLGSRLPSRDGYTDLAHKHQADLERFANELMQALQVHLAGAPR